MKKPESEIVHVITSVPDGRVKCLTMGPKDFDIRNYQYYATNADGEEIWHEKTNISVKVTT